MKIMRRRFNALFFVLIILLISEGLAEAQQNKFWAMELGNYWDYLEGPYDTWPSRNQVTGIDTATFPSPTYLVATTDYQNGAWVPMENWWYDIYETGPNTSELRVWRIMLDIDEGGPATLNFYSGIIWAKRPMTVGDFWTSSATGTYDEGAGTESITITANSEVLSYEPVDVFFGNQTYNAYKIRHFIQIPGLAQLNQTIYVVPYLGIIKNEIVDDEGYEADYLSSVSISTVFYDALYDHWAYPYIMQIYDDGITLGYGDGRYGPDDPVTREQMAVFILKALNDVPSDGYCGGTAPFADVLPGQWSCKYIKKLYELGITTGYQDGRYGPEDSVTREQMAVFITRALGQVPQGDFCQTPSPFIDVLDNRWSCKYVQKLYELGIAGGYGDGRYGPGDEVTRAQMAVFLSRASLD